MINYTDDFDNVPCTKLPLLLLLLNVITAEQYTAAYWAAYWAAPYIRQVHLNDKPGYK